MLAAVILLAAGGWLLVRSALKGTSPLDEIRAIFDPDAQPDPGGTPTPGSPGSTPPAAGPTGPARSPARTTRVGPYSTVAQLDAELARRTTAAAARNETLIVARRYSSGGRFYATTYIDQAGVQPPSSSGEPRIVGPYTSLAELNADINGKIQAGMKITVLRRFRQGSAYYAEVRYA